MKSFVKNARQGKISYILRSILAITLCAVFTIAILASVPVKAVQTGDIIKVGYFDYTGFIENKNGEITGYGADYLDEIAKYTGWQYEYVYDSWENLLHRLETGDIDLLCTMQWTQQRAEEFEFCAVSSGMETASLCVKDTSKTLYNDYAAFDGMKIGQLKGSFQNEVFEKFAKNKGFDYIPIDYLYMKNLENAVSTREIDAYIAGGLSKDEGCRVVANFSVDPFYFVTTKGKTELMDKINDAMYQILTSKPDFATNLYKLHYEDFASRKPVFTKEEMQFITDNPILRVAFNAANNTPKRDSLSGELYDTMELVSYKCGINFEYIQPDTYTECLELVANGEADILSDLYSSKEFAKTNKLKLTDAYNDNPCVFIGKRGMSIKDKSEYSVGVNVDWVSTISFIRSNYPKYEIKAYADEAECNEALIKGQVDLVIQKYDMAPHYLVEHSEQDITIVSTSLAQYKSCFGVSERMPPVCVSILNKSIRSITDNEKEYISIANNTAKPAMSFFEMMIHYLPYLIGISMIAVIVVLMLFLRTRHLHTLELAHIAYTDALTGGDNLPSFRIKAEKLLKSSPDKHFAVVVLDINKFKAINDMYGYEVGDSLLIRLHQILKSCVLHGELLARDVADRFVMLLEEKDAHILCERLEGMMDKSAELSDNQLKKSVFKLILSCGVCHVNNYIPPLTSYIDHAYLAARTIKNSHCSSFAVYDTLMLETLNHEKELENIMDDAIRNHEFKVYLQPRIELATQTVAGSEALVRWQLPDKTIIQPDSFIPLFEKNGFIESVDFYMLTSVCQKMRERLDAGFECLPVSINQSRFLFYQKNYLQRVIDTLETYNIPPSLIEMEITESLFLDPNEDFVNILNALRDKGIRISLDDFGSGFSSLNMLRNIPLDIIKIDRDFLRISDEANTNRILIRKIVELAKELKMQVVCEGVETEEQMHFLESIGCDYAQGYYYSRPIPNEEFAAFSEKFNQ